jgi:hypothetical protein
MIALLHPEFVRRQQRKWSPVLAFFLLSIGTVAVMPWYLPDIVGFDEVDKVVRQFVEAGIDQDIDTMCELCDNIERTELESLMSHRYLFEEVEDVKRTTWHISASYFSTSGRSINAEFGGIIVYESGYERDLDASLTDVDGEWKIIGITFGP